ncbi:hypothetical protein EON83_15505 [bacterium]|nr:MAG: hypothetical protein EON83_15505 [bacterium]
MKSPSSAPPRSSSSSGRSSNSSGSSSGRLIKVKCSFCGNTFYSTPREAVCRKCNRPANRPMSIPLRIAAFFVPIFGLPYSLWLRPHSPLAGNQGLAVSLIGLLLYAAAFAARHFHIF